MKRLLLTLAVLLAASPAFAHPGHGVGLHASGFAAGFAHPLAGLDHVLAMLAVGLWAALSGGAARLAWPAAFVTALAGGFALTQAGFVVPEVETMIAASVLLLGAVIALGVSAPVVLGAAAIAAFGVAHGAAHGMELHGAPLPFAAGFTLASALLHLAGYGLAHALNAMANTLASRWPARLAGAGLVAAGAAIAVGLA